MHIEGCCASVHLINTSMRFANVHFIGFLVFGTNNFLFTWIEMDSCQFVGNSGVSFIVYLYQVHTSIINCIFSNNTNGSSVIMLRQNTYEEFNVIHTCTPTI